MIHRVIRHIVSPDKVTSQAIAKKSFSLDGLILLTECRDSLFMLQVQMWFSEEMVFVPNCVVFSYIYIENHFISENGTNDF